MFSGASQQPGVGGVEGSDVGSSKRGSRGRRVLTLRYNFRFFFRCAFIYRLCVGNP